MSHRDESELKSMQRRVTIAALLLLGVFVAGVVGYRIIGAPNHGWLDAVYMTMMLLTTTPLREAVPTFSKSSEIFTTVLLLFGATAAVYTLSMITAYIVEGDMTQGFRRRRMQKRIDAMQGHFIVCGAGQTGTSVIRELTSTARTCVAIEHSAQHLAELTSAFPEVAALHGDCSDDETLTRAGVQRAAGIVVCTDDDKNTLVTTVLARQLNPTIRVIARATSDKAAARLRGAGADGVVSPAQIGGMRLASELVRPSVVGFLDQMLRDTNRNFAARRYSGDDRKLARRPGGRVAQIARVWHGTAAPRGSHECRRVPVQPAGRDACAAGKSFDCDGRSRRRAASPRRRGAGAGYGLGGGAAGAAGAALRRGV